MGVKEMCRSLVTVVLGPTSAYCLFVRWKVQMKASAVELCVWGGFDKFPPCRSSKINI